MHKAASHLIAILLGVHLAAFSLPVFAERTHTLSNEYIRTDFTVEEGLPDNVVNAIAQTENGLLWVGTQTGLATFDGRQFHSIQLHLSNAPSQGAVHSLVVTKSGDLWIGSDAGISSIPKSALNGHNPKASQYYPLGSNRNDSADFLYQSRSGVLWAGSEHGLYQWNGSTFLHVLSDFSVGRIAEALNGDLLLITSKGLMKFNGKIATQDPSLVQSLHIHNGDIFNALQDRNGTMWFNTAAGVRRQVGDSFPTLQPSKAFHSRSERSFEDASGGVWITNDSGVYRAMGNQLQLLAPDVFARCVFSSQDGGLWLGTNGNGLIRFRKRVVTMYTKEDGMFSNTVMAVLPSSDGRLWVGQNCGLSVLDRGHFITYSSNNELKNTCVWSLAEDRFHNIWIATYGGGVFKFNHGHFTQYSNGDGLMSNIVYDLIVAHDDSIWLATILGVSHLENGRVTNYTTKDGLSNQLALAIHEDRAHTIWVETQGGIDRFDGRVFLPFAPIRSGNDLLATRFGEDSVGDLFTMNATVGVNILSGNQFKSLNDNLNMIDMVETPDQYLWTTSRNGVFHFSRDDLKNSAAGDEPLDYGVIDRADGLESTQCSVGFPDIATDAAGRLWIATVKGLAMVNLKEWPGPTRRLEVFLQDVLLDGKETPLSDRIVLPPATRRIEIHLAAVDLASPEKIHLQYRMEGIDTRWNDSDQSRTAVYTDISPGSHTFTVRATDNNGRWDRAGHPFLFVQRPLFYQTRLFLVLCVAAGIMVLTLAYLLRIRHLLTQTRTLLEERISERERIARDLHDTFFQGIQGLLLRFNTGTSQLSLEEPARRIFVEALEQSDRVMLEGRELVLDLRADETAASDLPEAFARAVDEFSKSNRPEFKVIVVGKVRQLNLVCATELFRIGREAIYNAFRHAHARSVEVEILYDADCIKIRIRDDGIGIDEKVIREGKRPGHIGLPGMNERAQRIGAKFSIWSKKDYGTEVEAALPAATAYSLSKDTMKLGWLFRWVQKN